MLTFYLTIPKFTLYFIHRELKLCCSFPGCQNANAWVSIQPKNESHSSHISLSKVWIKKAEIFFAYNTEEIPKKIAIK